MQSLVVLFSDPSTWAALVTLIVMEVVLGVDNLVFVSILTNRLPPDQRSRARRIGIALALILRLLLLGTLSWIVGLTVPVYTLPWPFQPAAAHSSDGHPGFAVDPALSWRDLILIAGGLFLVWKATREIHQTVDANGDAPEHASAGGGLGFLSAIVQILLLDLVFSIDSILTAVGMSDDLPVMVVAVVTAVTLMLVASGPLARFIHDNPTVVMLALGFLLLIGTVLVADGFGVHVPKGYIYAAMAFSAFVEGLNMMARRRRGASA
jgi:predicted tellurium resistance membrane protein TerC